MAAIAACEQPQEEVTPALDLNKTAAAVAADGGAVEFEVTANVDWTADADQDWVSVDPQTGNGNAKVKATVAANETADARTAKVTVKADKLTKTLTITQEGKKADDSGNSGEDPKPEPTVAWGMMGCFVDNLWGSDVPMTQEGEWIVAKGAQFTELTFKIRGNGSWDDATNIGVAPGAERGVVNGKVSVVTAEYSKANLGGDAADIKLNGEPGTYDVYFSFENLEVYVMEEGYKPGEKEPQNPDPVEITYTVVGTIADNAWSNNAAVGLMASEGDYLVAKNIPFVWNSTLYGGEYHRIEFKIVETGTWNGYAYPETNVDQYPNTEFTVSIGGENIAVDAPEGTYDVYFDKANLKVWVMAPGYKPGETPSEPVQPVEPVTEGVIWENDGTVGAATWSGSPYRFSIEGGDSLSECVAEIPAAVWAGMKIAPFSVNVQPAPEATWWQIRVLDGWWTNNDESGASDININTPGLVDNGNGTYTFVVDLTTNPELSTLIDTQHLLFAGDGFIINKIYFGEPEAPQQPEYTLDGKQWMAEMDGMPVLFDFGLTEEGMLTVALPNMEETAFALYMAGLYEVVPADATSGVIVFTQYDWEWDEFAEPVEIPYSELGATSVKVVCEAMFGITDPVSFTLVENPYEIESGTSGGGASGEVADGQYWFIEPTNQKVMTPLAETYTYGRPAAADAVNGASTAANAFTLLYNADWSCYTIQDSYGRYLYQGMMEDGYTPYRTISVSDELPAADDENLAFYMWTVFNNGDGTYDIYNCASYYSITYSPSYNNWEIYDPYESDFANLFPSLVKADNPIE